MQAFKRDFIDFMVRSDVLTFGDFVTKSGRRTPYFVNAGRYRTGPQLAELGRFYAAAIQQDWPENVDVLFGPAYKGIPLVATTSIALAEHGRTVGFCFNRKEAKDHGEGGTLVGAVPEDGDRVLIVEDVTTTGGSAMQAIDAVKREGNGTVPIVVTIVDRLAGAEENFAKRGIRLIALLDKDDFAD